MPIDTSNRNVGIFMSIVASLLIAGCGGNDSPPAPLPDSTSFLPLCEDVAAANGSNNPKELFSLPLVDPIYVDNVLPLGELEAGVYTPINHELGFKLNTTNVTITAPADLYVKSITSTEYLSGALAGEVDFDLTYEVCAHTVNGEKKVAVAGDYAHITSVTDVISTQIAGARCVDDPDHPTDPNRKCTIYFPSGYVIDKGTVIGYGGGTGMSDYKPGFDANLNDFREANVFVNPDRIGAEEGPGASFRYGACIYEYFPELIKNQYLEKVGTSAVTLRDAPDAPCGQLSSIGKAGTAAGIWMPEEKAALDISTDLYGVMGNVLVLADDFLSPATKMTISTDLTSVADVSGQPTLVSIEKSLIGDVNIPFKDMVPGTIYCVQGISTAEGVITDLSYYLELVDGGSVLKLERLNYMCLAINQPARIFGQGVMRFVR